MAVPSSIYNLDFVVTARGTDGKIYQTLSGSLKSTPNQGVILVQELPDDPCKYLNESTQAGVSPSQPVVVTRTTQDGLLKLTGITGDQVSFTTTNGVSGHFDYVTKQYLP